MIFSSLKSESSVYVSKMLKLLPLVKFLLRLQWPKVLWYFTEWLKSTCLFHVLFSLLLILLPLKSSPCPRSNWKCRKFSPRRKEKISEGYIYNSRKVNEHLRICLSWQRVIDHWKRNLPHTFGALLAFTHHFFLNYVFCFTLSLLATKYFHFKIFLNYVSHSLLATCYFHSNFFLVMFHIELC